MCIRDSDIGIGVGLGLHRMLAVEKGADAGIEAAELRDCIGTGAVRKAAGVIGEAGQSLAGHKIEFGAVIGLSLIHI